MTGQPHALQIRQARGFWERFIGLMGRSDPRGTAAGDSSALLIARCTSVHSCFMRYALDVVYLDTQGRITRQVPALAPWRCSWGGPGAAHVLEMPAGAIASQGLEPGMQLRPWPVDAGTGHGVCSARFVRPGREGHEGHETARTPPDPLPLPTTAYGRCKKDQDDASFPSTTSSSRASTTG
ncbi:DUF192 domain-containing protein [Verminephrobacter aporrectodeae subsp. tuberculatae]|uniref:DUF192 domain-containing protein n=1 Tax=Verminephrobacter aporrectodeae TaxID=1110389 RepID=UPI0022374E39|nr:DUF192 domain-containing protein [Verminephrobacter aporrectodeae]MCW5221325.1 DUF192 domain-containing protein [Verminephrobacter aporrectodeae subsp. tuberculatae]MCW5290616.1 DUF192 domain-containing protein [Verminephrobacter aporrectodeae subsp. tuberculatae]